MIKLNRELSKFISIKGFLNIENAASTLKDALLLENSNLEEECIKLIFSHLDLVLSRND